MSDYMMTRTRRQHEAARLTLEGIETARRELGHARANVQRSGIPHAKAFANWIDSSIDQLARIARQIEAAED